jgi:hypothetical protein
MVGVKMSSVAVDREVLGLIKAIAVKQGEQLGLSITKGEVVAMLVVAKAKELGVYSEKKRAAR